MFLIIVLTVLATAVGTAVATLLIPWFVRQTKARIAAQQEFAAAMKELSATVKVLADVPKMIAGHAAAAGAMALEIGKLREAVSQFKTLVMKPDTEPGPGAAEPLSFVSHSDEASADRAYRVAELWAEAAANGETPSVETLNRKAQEEIDRQSSMPSVSME